MSVRQSMLAILTMGPCYGSQLKAEFERRTDCAWPLNVGQVYTTLARLARDGLVEQRSVDAGGRERFAITDAGRRAVDEWYLRPAPVVGTQRDEFVMKVVLALTVPNVDVAAVLDAQGREASDQLARMGRPASHAAALVVAARRESLLAQLRWIDEVRAASPRTPWGLDSELPKRGRPQKSPLGAP